MSLIVSCCRVSEQKRTADREAEIVVPLNGSWRSGAIRKEVICVEKIIADEFISVAVKVTRT